MVNPGELSRLEQNNRICHQTQLPDSSLSEQKKLRQVEVSLPQAMTTPRRIEDAAFRNIGAQFDHQQLSTDHPDLTNNIQGHHCPHRHRASLNRVDKSGNIIQALNCSNLRPMERFLLEASTQQQPAVFVEPFAGQPSTSGGCWYSSSTSRK
jgi:hypothetical protein